MASFLRVEKGALAVNRDKPDRWKRDVALSVDMYNRWFTDFAPAAFRETRVRTTSEVEQALIAADHLRALTPQLLRDTPGAISTLRMATCPPIAVDRLIGLSGVKPSTVKDNLEKGKLPARMSRARLDAELEAILGVIRRMADPDIFPWLARGGAPTGDEAARAATIVADRLCGAVANPIIRNAQEKRQLAAIETWLGSRGYRPLEPGSSFDQMPPGTFDFRLNVPVRQESGRQVNLPVDAVIMPISAQVGDMPVLIEAKSAGDYTNVNKRRKEEAVKMQQLRETYGTDVAFGLFLCGYFDTGYLGYEAAEGIDWVWEHRVDDLEGLGL